ISSSSTVTYTSVYTNSEPWRFQWVSDEEPEAPQSPGQAPPSPNYVPGPEHPPSPDYVPGPKEPEQAPLLPDYVTERFPDYVPGPKEPEQAPLLPDYVTEPEYPEYLAPSDVKAPIADQPLPVDA
ncbi:hypothetical protein Tco_1275052, partial [Tanacetum coccineum]